MESPFEYRTGVILAEHSITDFGRLNSHQLRLRFDSARAGAIPAEHSITEFGRVNSHQPRKGMMTGGHATLRDCAQLKRCCFFCYTYIVTTCMAVWHSFFVCPYDMWRKQRVLSKSKFHFVCPCMAKLIRKIMVASILRCCTPRLRTSRKTLRKCSIAYKSYFGNHA